jgi:hypothetical protein
MKKHKKYSNMENPSNSQIIKPNEILKNKSFYSIDSVSIFLN